MHDELIKRLRNMATSDGNIKNNYIGLTLLQAADAIEDLQKRKHGKWITTRTIIHDGNPYCSLCDYEPYYARDVQSLNYCQNCGADMRQREE